MGGANQRSSKDQPKRVDGMRNLLTIVKKKEKLTTKKPLTINTIARGRGGEGKTMDPPSTARLDFRRREQAMH